MRSASQVAFDPTATALGHLHPDPTDSVPLACEEQRSTPPPQYPTGHPHGRHSRPAEPSLPLDQALPLGLNRSAAPGPLNLVFNSSRA